MRFRTPRRLFTCGGAAWLALVLVCPLAAQFRPDPSSGGVGIVGQFDSSIGANPARVSAHFVTAAADHPPVVMITVRMDRNWHIYSLTQPRDKRGGPQRTTIELAPSPKYRLLAPFRSHPAPNTHLEDTIAAWRGLEIQEHTGEVTFFAPLELAAGVDPASLTIRGKIDMLACEDSGQCVPNSAKFTARRTQADLAVPLREEAGKWPVGVAPLTEPTQAGSIQLIDSVVKWSGRLEPATVRPGDAAKLQLTAAAPADWHIYAYSERDDKLGSKPTLIAFESTWGLPTSLPTTDAAITTDDSVPKFGTMRYHRGRVTWTVNISVPKDAEPGKYPIAGVLGYMACKDLEGGVCEISKAAQFRTTLNVGDDAGAGTSADLTFAPATYPAAATVAAAWANMRAGMPAVPGAAAVEKSNVESGTPAGGTAGQGPPKADGPPYDLAKMRVAESPHSLIYFVGLAFVGGLILNLMPCVLPVIGLKVMSFVQQSGKSRGHALVLNAWYAAGIISVFLLLAVLAITIGLSWGGQFGSTTFNVVIAAVVFAMALSLLGVWEVPIPGFFGSGAVQDASAKEGPLGAFLKGVVTTVLATPCGAPFMAPAIAWAVGQPASTTLAIFASVGLGMAAPYLVVGVFPELLRFLPKPGAWMLTFKQLTGFILLGTVVYILYFVERAAMLPIVLLLVGIGMACWLFARTPLTADARERRQAWSLAGAVLLLFAVASFGWLYPLELSRFGRQSIIKEGWESFSLANLQRAAVDEGRTVIVDFSAEWCPNCKVLEELVLHTDPVDQAIARVGAVRMYADFTHYPPEIDSTIRKLKSNGVPVIAIFPGSRPYEPIVFRGAYKQAELVSALQQATPRSDVVASVNP